MKIVIIPGFTDHPEGKAFVKLCETLESKGHDLIKISWPNIPDDLANYSITNTLNHARNILKALNDEFIILGFSMGGIIATILASEFKTAKLGLVVSPYQAGSDDDLEGKYKAWKESGLREITSSTFGRLVLPYSFIEDARKYNALDYIGKVSCPKLFIVAGEDEKVSLTASQKLFAEAKEPKEWKVIAGSQHKYQYQEDKLEEINKIIVDFVESTT